ncbi:hypothetical protein C464_06215 [Halorubrum coriense DSM 10284]|uniref:Uncharacterized protein n=1 Tax=Halorubrum coriense DSM 10284 TaxID=1227466 RepID=M0EPJ2_9EURY|nr:hypothetical protein [Halorubrum coriense]ELZ48983.1 hypothetical protein C464_06215 [Halorubrum coriense DSM 10284]QRG24122.1 hypothetical protein HrrHm1_055 [Halorubrum virus Humcor1]
MRGTLTHLVTVEHYQETGETVDDGAGGTIPVEEWATVVDGEPGRFEPAGQGYVREDQGGRVYSTPRVFLPPRAAGEMVDTAPDGEPADYEYQVAVDEGDDWRLTIAGLAGQFAVTDVDVHYEGPERPSHVVIEVEKVDSEDN